jgi:repressor LexA
MEELTQIQRRVLEFIADTLASGRSAPIPREISDKFGWSSKRAAECHIAALIRKGRLTSEPGKARSLRVISPLAKLRARVVDIPVFGAIPAGLPQEREQDAEGCITVDVESIGFKPTRNTFALRVTGDSMVGRHIVAGDFVVLEHGPEPRNGQIVAALIDGASTLKTFVVKGGKPFLKAENPKYPDLKPAQELMI